MEPLCEGTCRRMKVGHANRSVPLLSRLYCRRLSQALERVERRDALSEGVRERGALRVKIAPGEYETAVCVNFFCVKLSSNRLETLVYLLEEGM